METKTAHYDDYVHDIELHFTEKEKRTQTRKLKRFLKDSMLSNTIPCLFLVSLHCGAVADFATLHPFDFDRNLFNFLLHTLEVYMFSDYFAVSLISASSQKLILIISYYYVLCAYTV